MQVVEIIPQGKQGTVNVMTDDDPVTQAARALAAIALT